MVSVFARVTVFALLAGGTIGLLACASTSSPVPSAPYLAGRTHVLQPPPHTDDDASLAQAMTASCMKLRAQPASRAIQIKGTTYGTYGHWHAICDELAAAPASTAPAILQARTRQVKMPGPGKFTGYYKPEMAASLTRHGPYQTPLLAKPDDLESRRPYRTRAEIMANLEDYEVIAWLKDPVDAYFLHIQGSGTLLLDDGREMHVGFAAKNGHPYVSIGKVLRDMGELNPPITADDIRDWLHANPSRADSVFNQNPSFIFFYLTPESSAGAYGVPLTPRRSLAVDRNHVPLGFPVRVKTTLTGPGETFDRIMFAHDVGSAIVGPSRGDIYFGAGEEADKLASTQNASGELWVLVPKTR